MRETFERHRDVATDLEKEQVWGVVEERLHARGPRMLPAVAAGLALAVLAALFWPHLPERQSAERLLAPPQHEPVAAPDDGQAGPTASRTEVDPRAAAGSRAAPSLPHDAEVRAPAQATHGAPPPLAAPAPASVRPESTLAGPVERAPLQLALHPGRGRIVGTVRDTLTGKAIPFANVLVLGTPWGAMTNDSGGFVISNVPPRDYELKAMIIGYQPKLSEAELDAGAEARVDFALNQALVGEMDLVEITASRKRIDIKGTEMKQDVKGMVGLKGGVVAQGGELHFRGGRTGDVQYRVKSTLPRGRAGGAPRSLGAHPTPVPPVIPITGGTKLPNDEVYDAMFFEHYGVNPLVPTEEDSLSTFALDVDTGSYTIARRYLELGTLPPKEAVRVEEFVNFFDQDYPSVEHGDFRILIDGAPSPFGPGYHLLRIGLKAREPERERHTPADLIFVIDVSGSMQREDRLGLVQRALGLLLDRLHEGDRVGIVAYQTHAWIVLEPTPISERTAIRAAVDRLTADGSTNAEAGLKLGYEMARRARRAAALTRIVLCADGVANEGNTGPESILASVRREADEGITLTTIGFGLGNYNDVLMEQLADRGDGSYHYVDDLEEATRLFDQNLGAMIETIGREAKVQVVFDPRRVTRYRLLGFENRDVADADFRNDRVDAGEIGVGHEVTALYEIKLAEGTHAGRIATVHLRYAPPPNPKSGATEVQERNESIDAGDLRGSFEEASSRLRLDAAVVELAEILRKSYWAKGSRIADLVPMTARLAEDLAADPAVVELHQLVTKAAGLSELRSPDEPADTLPAATPE